MGNLEERQLRACLLGGCGQPVGSDLAEAARVLGEGPASFSPGLLRVTP